MKVAALWSGGKDSSLSCYKAINENKLDVAVIVTFIWEKPSLAHPLSVIHHQAEALQIPLHEANVKEPYKEEYRKTILKLKQDHGIEAVVTGDISYVDDFHGNWIDDVCKGTGVEVIKPIWELDRASILSELMTQGFKPMFTCVKEPWFTKEWLGRMLDNQSIKELKEMHKKNNVDLCGENGEYHTMILDAPFFKKKITIPKYTIEKINEAYVLKPAQVSLVPK
jgi:diphthine-ammonia ligase